MASTDVARVGRGGNTAALFEGREGKKYVEQFRGTQYAALEISAKFENAARLTEQIMARVVQADERRLELSRENPARQAALMEYYITLLGQGKQAQDQLGQHYFGYGM